MEVWQILIILVNFIVLIVGLSFYLVGRITNNKTDWHYGKVVMGFSLLLFILICATWIWVWIFQMLCAQTAFGASLGWFAILSIASIPLMILVIIGAAVFFLIVGALASEKISDLVFD